MKKVIDSTLNDLFQTLNEFLWKSDLQKGAYIMEAVLTKEIVEVSVEAERLATGGDISDSYSADVIAESGKIRKTFFFEGKEFVAISGVGSGDGVLHREMCAYQIIPLKDFKEKTLNYSETDRHNEGGFYNRVKVKFRKKDFVLIAPEYKFIPKSDKPKKLNIEFDDVEKADQFNEGQVYQLNMIDIAPSPMETQKRRRSRFKPDETKKLAQSIKKTNGVLQPILVRLKENGTRKFEIVFGERRYLAEEINRSVKIKAFIRDLTTAEVLELQWEENHRRQENHPLDDAFVFKYEMDFFGLNEKQIADKFNTSEKNVTEKLRLNDLLPEFTGFFESETLPYKHALFIAKFPPDAQKEILDTGLAFEWHAGEIMNPAHYFEMVEEIEQNILRSLDSAPFDIDNPDLHTKGLICPNCPERTGYSPLLFPDIRENDSCLNKNCFQIKTNTHLELKRQEIAKKMPNPERKNLKEIERSVPLVTDKSYTIEPKVFKEKVQKNQKLLAEPECEYSAPALVTEGRQKGEEVFICQNEMCEIHHSKKDIENDSKLKTAQLKFDKELLDKTNEFIFPEALKFFTGTNPFWTYADLVSHLIARLIGTSSHTEKEFVLKFIKKWKNAPSDFYDERATSEFIENLDRRELSQILFLFTFANRCLSGDRTVLAEITRNFTKLGDFYFEEAKIFFDLTPREHKKRATSYVDFCRQRETDKPVSLDEDVKPEPPKIFWKEDKENE